MAMDAVLGQRHLLPGTRCSAGDAEPESGAPVEVQLALGMRPGGRIACRRAWQEWQLRLTAVEVAAVPPAGGRLAADADLAFAEDAGGDAGGAHAPAAREAGIGRERLANGPIGAGPD